LVTFGDIDGILQPVNVFNNASTSPLSVSSNVNSGNRTIVGFNQTIFNQTYCSTYGGPGDELYICFSGPAQSLGMYFNYSITAGAGSVTYSKSFNKPPAGVIENYNAVYSDFSGTINCQAADFSLTSIIIALSWTRGTNPTFIGPYSFTLENGFKQISVSGKIDLAICRGFEFGLCSEAFVVKMATNRPNSNFVSCTVDLDFTLPELILLDTGSTWITTATMVAGLIAEHGFDVNDKNGIQPILVHTDTNPVINVSSSNTGYVKTFIPNGEIQEWYYPVDLVYSPATAFSKFKKWWSNE